MGFKVQRTIFKLTFKTGSMLDGLHVQARSISADEVFALSDEADTARSGTKNVKEIRQLIARFIDELVEWDLEFEDGTTTEPTVESFLRHDLSTVLAIVLSWFDAMLHVGDELGKDLTSGRRFPEESIPMELK